MTDTAHDEVAATVDLWPQWVSPHETHIVHLAQENGPVRVVVPLFPEFHVNRATGEVTVLVNDQDEYDRAVNPAKHGEPDPEGEPDKHGEPDPEDHEENA